MVIQPYNGLRSCGFDDFSVVRQPFLRPRNFPENVNPPHISSRRFGKGDCWASPATTTTRPLPPHFACRILRMVMLTILPRPEHRWQGTNFDGCGDGEQTGKCSATLR